MLAYGIKKIYRNFGLEGYIEYSGCRGYHVWLLFTEWIPVRYANMFCDVLLNKLGKIDNDLTIEFFPNKTRIKQGKYGQSIKLPYGIHSKSGERSFFIEDEEPILDVNAFMDGLARFQLPAIKQILAANTGIKVGNKNLEVDMSLYGDLSSNVKEVLNNCNLMKYLCQKAALTGYLSHFERLTILYVFGHLGDEGKEFVHKIMSFTLNYQYNITQKFINRRPEKPISCLKLRDQYKNITAEYGCNCNFKRVKNCYPSPVLHAIALSNVDSENVTVPTSRTLSKEKTKKVINELNIHSKTQELAVKAIELKKQRRKIDSSIAKVEAELGRIFDDENIDCLEIELGLVVRRKTDSGYEWGIEL